MKMITSALDEQYAKADKVMLLINYSLLAYAVVLASWYSTWFEMLFIGGLTTVALTCIFYSSAGHLICRISMSIGFVVFTALHIHQTKGAIEAHFGVFILLAVLLYYRDWVPVAVNAGLIAIHHLLFFYLQASGNAVFLLPVAEGAFPVVIWHALYVVFQAGLMIWFCLNLKKEATQSIEVMSLTGNIINDNTIDLTLRSSGSTELLCRFDLFTEGVEDLAKKVVVTSLELNESGQSLASATGNMKDKTQSLLRESDQIAAAAEQMSTAVSEVSNNAETAANIVRDVEENSERAKEIGSETQYAMEQLANQVDMAAKTIDELNEQTRDIGSVLDVIRGVAEQTNLLALNAAIEAARAGEQGRGFAVVADEVRTLAQRTQQSTEEIDKMIEQLQTGSSSAVSAIESSQRKVSDCVTSTVESQAIMTQVSDAIQQVNTMSDMIATASNEQSTVINEISRNLANIVETTNGAVEDANTINESGASLLNMSEQLNVVTQQFRTN